ncbi:MAG: hypothetical protein IKW57_01615, partial [Alphaproteobacteria bacterium]|nr:hypothetical protein [Alphaproteobacteria bacterium]
MFLLAFFIAIPTFTITSTTAFAATYTCEYYYLDLLGDDSAYEKAMEKCDWGTCNVVNGTVTCGGGGSTSCTCPSGYSGSCSGSNYSTCYKSCSVSCLNAGGLDTTACKNSIAYGNGWIDCNDSSNYTVVNVTGTQYYGGSCSSNTKCAFYNICGASCPSGYTAGGTQYNSCQYTADEACYKTCTRACTQTGCPSGYSCTYNSSSTSGKQYYGGSCGAASSNCSINTQTCNTLCSAVSNTTSTQSCTRSCSIANGTCSYSGSKQTCNGKYTN